MFSKKITSRKHKDHSENAPMENAFADATRKLDLEYKAGRHTDVCQKVLNSLTYTIEVARTEMYREENFD